MKHGFCITVNMRLNRAEMLNLTVSKIFSFASQKSFKTIIHAKSRFSFHLCVHVLNAY